MNKERPSRKRSALSLIAALSAGLMFTGTAVGGDVNLNMTKGEPFTDHYNTNLDRIIYTPLASYRVGPYAEGGTGYYGGEIDLFRWINLTYGGISAKPGDPPIPIVWDECETEWDTPRGVECYERYKNKGPYGATANDPLSVGIAYALQEKTRADRIPSITPNHGNTASQDGRVFPYQFPVEITPYDETSIMVQFAEQQSGGSLKGKKIAVLYHGSAYGRETIGLYNTLSEMKGFKLQQIEVPHPGNEQTSIWMRVRQFNPDFVMLRGWGVMVPVALKTAVKVGYPVSQVIGNIWSNSEGDVLPAGAAGKDYVTINTQAPGKDWPLIQTLWNDLYQGGLAGGEGDMKDPKRVGHVYYNLGVVAGIIHVEAMRTALAEFGPDMPLDGKHKRWGLENLNLNDEKLAEYGVLGMMQNVYTSCEDHTGGHRGKMAAWNGESFDLVSKDWIVSDLDVIWPLIYERSEKYAAENNIKIRDCSDPADNAYMY